MILVLHILTAIGSLAAAGAAYAKPSENSLRATYGLTAAMLASGTYLVVANTSHLLEACVMGLGLLSVILYATAAARRKLRHEHLG